MKIKNKFILSLIILCFCICSFLITLILRPFNKSIVIMVCVVSILLFFFAMYFTTIYYRRWQGYYSTNNKFFMNLDNEEELFNKVIKSLTNLGYYLTEETEIYCLYEFINKKKRTTYYFLIYKNKKNHEDKSYLKLVRKLNNKLPYYWSKLSTKSGHLVVIEELTLQDRTKLYTESKKMTCDFLMLDYNNRCSYIESSSLLNSVEQRREIKKVLKDVIVF